MLISHKPLIDDAPGTGVRSLTHVRLDAAAMQVKGGQRGERYALHVTKLFD